MGLFSSPFCDLNSLKWFFFFFLALVTKFTRFLYYSWCQIFKLCSIPKWSVLSQVVRRYRIRIAFLFLNFFIRYGNRTSEQYVINRICVFSCLHFDLAFYSIFLSSSFLFPGSFTRTVCQLLEYSSVILYRKRQIRMNKHKEISSHLRCNQGC